MACEMMDGPGVIVTDCKGAAVVANKLKAGHRRSRGPHARVETRILASIGDKQVQWMRSHLTAQQAADADLPAGYQSENAKADLLAGQAVREVPGLPPLLAFYRQAAAAARAFWSLFPSFSSPLKRVSEELDKSQRQQEPAASAAAFLATVA
eukprot:6455780-Amphidinium_carterae.1